VCCAPAGSRWSKGRPSPCRASRRSRRGSAAERDTRIAVASIDGAIGAHHVHDEASLRAVCAAAGVAQPAVYLADWAGRERLFLRFVKARARAAR
jgi:hypothetical protein